MKDKYSDITYKCNHKNRTSDYNEKEAESQI